MVSESSPRHKTTACCRGYKLRSPGPLVMRPVCQQLNAKGVQIAGRAGLEPWWPTARRRGPGAPTAS